MSPTKSWGEWDLIEDCEPSMTQHNTEMSWHSDACLHKYLLGAMSLFYQHSFMTNESPWFDSVCIFVSNFYKKIPRKSPFALLTPPCCPSLLSEMMYGNVNQQILAPINKTCLEVSGKSLFPKFPYDVPSMSVVSVLIANTCLGIWEHTFVRLFPFFEGQLAHYAKCQVIFKATFMIIYLKLCGRGWREFITEGAVEPRLVFYLWVSNASANGWRFYMSNILSYWLRFRFRFRHCLDLS